MNVTVEPNGHSITPIAELAARERPLHPGDLIAGRYRLDSVIGRGGMATVFRGHDERLSRDVAIKVCQPDPDCPSPPLQEERVSSALSHSNIVPIFDAGEIPHGQPGAGSTFIVMEYVRGTTAHEIAPVSWERAVDIVLQAAQGLAATHERGIVHCDVKPSNLLIDRQGRVLVADFGVAVEAESAAGEYVHGSPSYIAPERLSGQPADSRVDVFGLGGVLAYLLTGSNPPVEHPPGLPSSCPAPVRDVIYRSRAQQPASRYPDASAFRDALAAAASASATLRAKEDVVVRAAEATRHVPVEARPFLLPNPAEATAVRRQDVSDAARTAVAHRPVRAARRRSSMALRPAQRATGAIGRTGTILIVVCIVLLISIIGSTTMRDPGPVSPGAAPAAAAVEMPDVSGGTFGEAVAVLSERGLTVARVEVIYGPGPLNQVVAQEPAAGDEVDSTNEIVLVVRTGR